VQTVTRRQWQTKQRRKDWLETQFDRTLESWKLSRTVIRQRSLLKLLHLAEGCIEYCNAFDTTLLPRATELTTRESLQTTASLIGEGCRTLKSSGRTWSFLVRYSLYVFTGVGLNPTKIHYYKNIICPIRDNEVYDFLLYILIIISSSLLVLYITHSLLISLSYCRHLILLCPSLLPPPSDKTVALLYPFLSLVSFLPAPRIRFVLFLFFHPFVIPVSVS
jgi:hypothetical protein